MWSGKEGCEHVWETVRTDRPNQGGGQTEKQATNAGSFAVDNADRASYSDTCALCGAWRGELGAEPDLRDYVRHLVEVFSEVWRVLRSDGTCWLNLGDSYARGFGGGTPGEKQKTNNGSFAQRASRKSGDGFKDKDLCMVPHRTAIALQDAGWWVRSDICWAKGVSFCSSYSGSVMPESVTDRPAKSHETVFLLAKSERYFFDMDAVREGYSEKTLPQLGVDYNGHGQKAYSANGVQDPSDVKRHISEGLEERGGRNVRSVWTINPQPFPGSHFATMPVALAQACISLGSSEGGVCGGCGAPWRRVVERERTFESGSGRAGTLPVGKNGAGLQGGGETGDIRRGPCVSTRTLGWQPTCACNADPIPATCLDPFSGSGTTGVAALQLGRDYLGLELNGEYAELSRNRLRVEGSGGRMRFPKARAGQETLAGLFTPDPAPPLAADPVEARKG